MKETHKSSIFYINRHLKITKTIVYSTTTQFVFNRIICASEGKNVTHSLLILAHSEEVKTFHFLSSTTAKITVTTALYRLWRSQTHWKTQRHLVWVLVVYCVALLCFQTQPQWSRQEEGGLAISLTTSDVIIILALLSVLEVLHMLEN